jgi:integrase
VPPKAKKIRIERGLYRAGNTYYACATPPGERQASWKTLGEIGLMGARRRRDEFAVEIHRLPAVPPRRSLKFAEVAREWLLDQQHRVDVDELTQRTYDGYEAGLRLHCLPTLGRRPVGSVTPDQLVAWHRQQLAGGYARDSIHAWWTPLRLVLAHAVRHGLIFTNPADQLMGHERPKAGQARKRFLSRDEMRRLLGACPARYRLAISVGLFAGLRLSEILGLVWADIDFTGNQVWVRFQMGRDGERRRLKTHAGSREVILMAELAREFKRHRLASRYAAAGDLVFATETGRTLGHRNLTGRGLAKACERAKLHGVTCHSLRHTFASILIDQGRDPVFVSRQLGHANPAITLRVYAHLFDAARHAREARDELDAEYGNLLAQQQ